MNVESLKDAAQFTVEGWFRVEKCVCVFSSWPVAQNLMWNVMSHLVKDQVKIVLCFTFFSLDFCLYFFFLSSSFFLFCRLNDSFACLVKVRVRVKQRRIKEPSNRKRTKESRRYFAIKLLLRLGIPWSTSQRCLFRRQVKGSLIFHWPSTGTNTNSYT